MVASPRLVQCADIQTVVALFKSAHKTILFKNNISLRLF